MAAPCNQQALSPHRHLLWPPPRFPLPPIASFLVVDPWLALWASELSLLHAGPGTHPSSQEPLSS